MIDPTDRGLLLADGVFETVLVENGMPWHIEAHISRLERGCDALNLPRPDRTELGHAIGAALRDETPPERAALRITYTAGSGGHGLDRPEDLKPITLVRLSAAPKPEGTAKLWLSSIRRNETSPASHHKTLNYLDNVLARQQARQQGADEALMCNSQGQLTCAAAANLFWLKDYCLYTPALSCGVLPGLTRQRLINRAHDLGLAVQEVTAPPAALTGASLFLSNSLMGLRPASLDPLNEAKADPDLISALSSQV